MTDGTIELYNSKPIDYKLVTNSGTMHHLRGVEHISCAAHVLVFHVTEGADFIAPIQSVHYVEALEKPSPVVTVAGGSTEDARKLAEHMTEVLKGARNENV